MRPDMLRRCSQEITAPRLQLHLDTRQINVYQGLIGFFLPKVHNVHRLGWFRFGIFITTDSKVNEIQALGNIILWSSPHDPDF